MKRIVVESSAICALMLNTFGFAHAEILPSQVRGGLGFLHRPSRFLLVNGVNLQARQRFAAQHVGNGAKVVPEPP